MTIDHFRKLENMYLKARFNQNLYETTTINISEKKAVITMDAHEKYFHAMGAIHGSVYFKLLDDAAFFAVNSVVEDVFVLTTNFNINIVRPVNHGKMRSIGKIKSTSKRLYIAESEMYDEKDRLVAFGLGHFMKSRTLLEDIPGYEI